MPLQCTMSFIFDWEVRRLGMRDTLKHGTITVSGFGYFHKNCRFLWGKKYFKGQIQEVQYTIPIRHITNISDCVWFQRSCGSMKSVSSFSSIDVINQQIQSLFLIQLNNPMFKIDWRLDFLDPELFVLDFLEILELHVCIGVACIEATEAVASVKTK